MGERRRKRDQRPAVSDQLPEDAPAEHLPEGRERGENPPDKSRPRSRSRTATGNPRSAGEDPGDDQDRERDD